MLSYRQPLREAVSWNCRSCSQSEYCSESASSWGCELKFPDTIPADRPSLSASSWGCELKYWLKGTSSVIAPSASSWGCELKYLYQRKYWHVHAVSLFVRLWVEMKHLAQKMARKSQPLREAVSWNMTGDYMVAVQEGQPLREAVSWNSLCQRNLTEKVGSASSWGCELKYYSLIITGKCFTVSLFVRLWVEMYDRGWNDALEKSASSWGCELK